MLNLKKLLLAAMIVVSAGAQATTTTINATGEGWCSQNNGCNNTSVNHISNTIAGNFGGGGDFHNWFAFNIGSGTISSATLSIWNAGSNQSSENSAVYDLHAASGISLAGLINGVSFGSISAGAADTGVSHYVNINLNEDGINFLNGNQGNNVVFGGGVTQGNSVVRFFGYTGGTPVAQLTTVSAVPEPETYGMLLAGLGLMGFITRRKSKNKVA